MDTDDEDDDLLDDTKNVNFGVQYGRRKDEGEEDDDLEVLLSRDTSSECHSDNESVENRDDSSVRTLTVSALCWFILYTPWHAANCTVSNFCCFQYL